MHFLHFAFSVGGAATRFLLQKSSTFYAHTLILAPPKIENVWENAGLLTATLLLQVSQSTKTLPFP